MREKKTPCSQAQKGVLSAIMLVHMWTSLYVRLLLNQTKTTMWWCTWGDTRVAKGQQLRETVISDDAQPSLSAFSSWCDPVRGGFCHSDPSKEAWGICWLTRHPRKQPPDCMAGLHKSQQLPVQAVVIRKQPEGCQKIKGSHKQLQCVHQVRKPTSSLF